MSLVQIQGNASGTGTLTIAAPSTNTNRTLTLPDGTGTFTMSGVNSNIVSGTAQNSTSGTAVDFTGIPSWVKRITIMFNGVSTGGTSDAIVQIGAGSSTSTGYASSCVFGGATTGGSSTTGGFLYATSVSGTSQLYGTMILNLYGGNTWFSTGTTGYNLATPSAYVMSFTGVKTLTGTLDRVRITSISSDTFDAGAINILYE